MQIKALEERLNGIPLQRSQARTINDDVGLEELIVKHVNRIQRDP